MGNTLKVLGANPAPVRDRAMFRNVLRQIFRLRYWMLGLTTLITVMAMVYAWRAVPVFRAKTLLAPVGMQSGGVRGELIAKGLRRLSKRFGIGGSQADRNKRDIALAILHSRRFTRRFIERYNLLPQLFANKWDANHNTWIGPSPDYKAAIKKMIALSKTSLDFRSGMITLSIDWYEPEKASMWVNDLVFFLNESMRQKAMAEVEKNIEFLNEQLHKSSLIAVHQLIYQLLEDQKYQAITLRAEREYALQVVDRAVVPGESVSLNSIEIICGGFVSGLILSLCLVYMQTCVIRTQKKANGRKRQ